MASVLLLATFVRASFVGQDFTAFDAWSELGISLFLLTLAYGVASVWSLVNIARLRKANLRKRIWIPAVLLTLLHLALTIYMASYGMIGARIWTW